MNTETETLFVYTVGNKSFSALADAKKEIRNTIAATQDKVADVKVDGDRMMYQVESKEGKFQGIISIRKTAIESRIQNKIEANERFNCHFSG